MRVRSTAAELLDAPDVDAAVLERCLRELGRVNTATLARPPTLAFLRRAARRVPPGRVLSVLDVGFGGGDMLRRIARWGARSGIALRLEGVDLNPHSAAIAARATPPDAGIVYRTGDAREAGAAEADVVISSLVAHHMRDDELIGFLRWMERTARVGWFVNDLHRHALALHGFRALAAVAGWDRVVRQDGAQSVRRAFRRADWARLLQDAGLERVARVRAHVPFRLCVERLR